MPRRWRCQASGSLPTFPARAPPRLCCLGCFLGCRLPAYTVKVNAKFPASNPALRGLICLHDLDHGDLVGVVDSASITAWRTGLAAALATHVLAPASAMSVAFVGAGAQAARVLAGLVHLRHLAQVIICDLDCDRADAFTQAHVPPGLPAVRASSAADAADQADILVLATWSQTALLGPCRSAPWAACHLSRRG